MASTHRTISPRKFSGRDITKSADTYVDTYRKSTGGNKQILGFEKTSFPMIRPEKEEMFSSMQSPSKEVWTDPIHMKRLDNYLRNE